MLTDDIPLLLPLHGTEDAFHLVDVSKLGKKDDEEKLEDTSAVEWGIEVHFSKNFGESQLWNVFSPLMPTGSSMDDQIFPGTDEQDIEKNLFVEEDEDEELPRSKYSRLQTKKRKRKRLFKSVYVFVRLLNPSEIAANFQEDEEDDVFEPEIVDEQDLQKLLDKVKERVWSVDKNAQIELEESPSEAMQRAEDIATILHECDTSITLKLLPSELPSSNLPSLGPEAPQFGGRDIWDTMKCLGLQFEETKRFCCSSEECLYFTVSSIGDKEFDPVEMSNDKKFPGILFDCYLPHCYNPVETAKAMLKAAEYCQKRLGGVLYTETYQPVVWEELEKEALQTVERLVQNGFQPGGDLAREYFD